MAYNGKWIQGMGEASSFLLVPWVQEQLQQRLGFAVFPGTLNLEVEDMQGLARQRYAAKPLWLDPPPGSGYCRARLYRLRLCAGRFRGAWLVPDIDDYPQDKVEVVAECDLSSAAGLRPGDLIEFDLDPAA